MVHEEAAVVQPRIAGFVFLLYHPEHDKVP